MDKEFWAAEYGGNNGSAEQLDEIFKHHIGDVSVFLARSVVWQI